MRVRVRVRVARVYVRMRARVCGSHCVSMCSYMILSYFIINVYINKISILVFLKTIFL